MRQKKGTNGTGSITRRSKKSFTGKWEWCVSSVGTRMRGFLGTLASAAINAGRNGEETLVSMMLTENASNVMSSSESTGTPRKPAATTVYNITVDDLHEYFANGVLVSNCDCVRYVVVSTQHIRARALKGYEAPKTHLQKLLSGEYHKKVDIEEW